MTKRIISYLLVALMLLTSVPVGAFAASDEIFTDSLTVEFIPEEALGVSLCEGPSPSLFSRGSYSGSYGNQLEGLAREFYDAIEEFYAQDKNNVYCNHTLKESMVFDLTNEYEAKGNEIKSATQVASDAFVYDHPEIFWIRNIAVTFSTSVSKDSTTGRQIGKITKVTFAPMEIYTNAKLNQEAFDIAVDEAVEEITASVSDIIDRYEVLKATHDYICNNAWYNPVAEKRVHTAEPFFIGDGGVVCEGYAKAFKIICDKLGIPCALVSGEANGGAHMWNYVQLDDGKWYLIDATWDDQNSGIYYTYFLANANTTGFLNVEISKERTADGDFSSTGYINFIYPELSSTAYVYHIHEWDTGYTVDVNATCTEPGSKSIHCESCDSKKEVTEIPALDHEFKNYISDNNATCSADGTKTAKCERCDEIDTITDEGSKVDHEWNNWESVSAPTCTTGGVEKRACKNCTASETRNVGATNHANAYLTDEVAPDCTDVGYEEGLYCPDCKIWISGHEEIPALDHDFRNYISDNNATCSADGTKTAKCERCDETDTITDEGSKVDHEWNNWESVSAPTCTTGGVEKRTCKNCTASETRNVSETNHANAYLTDEVAPDCTEVGYEEGLYCPDCKIWISGHEEIPALDHEFKNYTSDNNATCSVDGTKTAKCERCDETDTIADEDSKVDHEWNNWESVSAPTCTTGGVEKRTCKNCTASETRNVSAINHTNAYLTDEVAPYCTEVGYEEGLYCPDCKIWISGHEEIPALDHEFKNYTSDNNATCSADGTKTAKCERCDETDTITDEGSKVDHEWNNWESVSAPTCTTGGVEKRTCKNCTASETRNVSATNHANAYLTDEVAPDCTEVGYEEGLYCPECKIWISGHEEIPALDHDFRNYSSDNNATCSADGTKTAKCERCDETDTITDEGSKVDHEWSEWGVEIYPTCTKDGAQVRSCSSCNVKERKIIDATNHPDAYVTEAVEPSCTAVGYTEGLYCPECEEWASGHITIERLPHKFTEKIIDLDHLISMATVVDLAVYGYECADCDEISKTETFTFGERLPLGKTKKITASSGSSAINLSWTAVDYAVGYKVYQKVSGGWKSLKNVTSTSAKIEKLSAGTKYTFAVIAATRINGKVVWAKSFTTISTATQAPLPTTINAKQTTSAIQLTWNACKGATGYRIYVLEGEEWNYLSQVKGTKATIKNLKAGKKYTYAIRPYISVDGGSVVWSAYKTYTAATKPTVPVTTVASAAKGKITVKWKAVSGAEAYQLYYKTANGSYKLYNNYTGAKTVNFSNLKSGAKFTFAVRAAIKTSGGWIFGAYTPVNVTVK